MAKKTKTETKDAGSSGDGIQVFITLTAISKLKQNK